jgi:hypothetical protein
MNKTTAASLMLLLCPLAATAAIIDAGNPVITQSNGQSWIITIEGDVNDSEQIESVDLYLTIGDGVSGDTSTKPLFTDLSMNETGYFFAGVDDTTFVNNPTSYVGASVNNAIPLNFGETTNLALVTLDASSASQGTWQWSLIDPSTTPNRNTQVNGSDDLTTLIQGTITVVPEPAGLIQLLIMVAFGSTVLCWRRRRKCAS